MALTIDTSEIPFCRDPLIVNFSPRESTCLTILMGMWVGENRSNEDRILPRPKVV